MAKVSAKVGLTLKISKDSQYEFIRPEISIEGIDTEGDVQKQLDDAVKTLRLTWETVKSEMNTELIAQMPNVDKQMELQVANKMKAMDNRINAFIEEIRTSVKKGG